MTSDEYERNEDELARDAQLDDEDQEIVFSLPTLGELYEFGPDKRRVQVVGLDWNELNGELTLRMRTYQPPITRGGSFTKGFSGLPALPKQFPGRDA